MHAVMSVCVYLLVFIIYCYSCVKNSQKRKVARVYGCVRARVFFFVWSVCLSLGLV